MASEQREMTGGNEAKATKAHKFLGSLKDALMAAGRDETDVQPVQPAAASTVAPAKAANLNSSPSAEEAARLARTPPPLKATEPVAAATAIETDAPPTTRVLRGGSAKAPKPEADAAPRTVLVRGKQKIAHDTFERDPAVGFLIVVGGRGLGSFRPIFEGNNTVGRAADNRIPLDFGDDAISSEAQAYIRYDSNDRSFLFVPNLAKTNIVSVNDKRPTGPVSLQAMDVITIGRTQVAFLPFCGAEFDWSEISET
jgi:hypothetical protein